MTDARRHTCTCNHDRASHIKVEPMGGAVCTVRECECHNYVDRDEPKPTPHAGNCFCRACSEAKVRGHG